MYNVLWFDDEHEKFETFEALAEYQGIKLHPVDVRQAGLDELRLHPNNYDAILLDAKMPEKSVNEVAGINGVKDVVNAAHELHIPVYISTGQPDLQQDKTFRLLFDNVFIKGDKTDDFGGDDELFAKMLSDLGQSEKAEIHRRFADVFTALDKMCLSSEGDEILLPILQALCFPENHPDFDAKHNFNQLRIFIEYLFRIFMAAGILPPDFENAEGLINKEISLYLSGLTPKYIPYRHEGAILPRHISDVLKNLLMKGNMNSHSRKIGEQSISVDYLFASHAYLICEMVMWAYDYLLEHPNPEENSKEWIKIEE